MSNQYHILTQNQKFEKFQIAIYPMMTLTQRNILMLTLNFLKMVKNSKEKSQLKNQYKNQSKSQSRNK